MSGTPTAVHVSRGASYLVVQNMTTTAVTIISFAVLARIISPREMGIWSVLLLINGICQTLGTFSIQQAAAKFVAQNMSDNQANVAASVFYQSLKSTLLSSILIASTVFLFAPELSRILLGDFSYENLFRLLAIDIVLNTGLLQVLGSVLLGLQKFKEIALINTAVGAFLRQSAIIALIILLSNFVGLVFGWILSDLVSILAYFWCAYSSLGSPKFNFSIRRLIDFAWPLSVSSMASFAQTWFDRALLIAFVPLAILGIYNAALVAFGALLSITNAMPSVLFPAFSAVQSKKDDKALGNATRSASRYTSLVGVPLAFGLLATAKPALTLFVGRAYVDGAVPLMILSAIYGFTVFGTTVLPSLLLALGKTGLVCIVDIVSVVMGLGAALILLPISGITGAAIAHGLAMGLPAVLMLLILRRKMTLSVDYSAVVKSTVAGAVMAGVVLATQLMIYRVYLLPAYVLLGGIVYLTMLRILRTISQADIDLLRSYSGRRLTFVVNLLNRILLPNGKPQAS